jgi:LytS/YehU family sensor histidine kinase
VRKVLELSSVTDVPLEQEIETLKLYIELESMLLQSDFSYAVLVDEDVDISGVQIPTLLLQPYVENAFKHGLRHKTGSKKLLIKISINNAKDVLTIDITDDGIGRAASELINNQNGFKHKSFALSAIEKRIQLLNFEKRDLVGVEIIDNFEKGQPTGTSIIIRIHV